MKKTLTLIITLLIAILFIVPLSACSKPTEAFKTYSSYLERNGISNSISYNNLNSTYFGKNLSITVTGSEHIIFFIFTTQKNMSLTVSITDYSPAVIDVLYSIGSLSVFMTDKNLYSVDSFNVSSVEESGVKQSPLSNYYSDAAQSARRALDEAIPWMTRIMHEFYFLYINNYTVHDLYNH